MSLPAPVWVMQLLQSVEGSGLGMAVRNTAYLYPILMALHVLGIALLLGPVVAVDLRLLGFGRRIVSVTTAAKCLLPLARIGFAIVVVTGVAMFFGIAKTVWASAAAPWKFGLIAVALLNLLFFHISTFRNVHEWDVNAPAPLPAKASALISAACWSSTVFAGRFLAY